MRYRRLPIEIESPEERGYGTIRNNLTESASVGGIQTYPNATGFCQFRVDARYFRVRLVTAASTDFLHLIGVEVKAVPTRRR